MSKKIVCLLLFIAIFIGLTGCNQKTDEDIPKPQESTITENASCNGHPLYGGEASTVYHRFFGSFDEIHTAYEQISQLHDNVHAYAFDSGDMTVFYVLEATNANSDASDILGFIADGSDISFKTYILLDKTCSNQDGESVGVCLIRTMAEFSKHGLSEIENSDTAILKIYNQQNVVIEDASLLSFQTNENISSPLLAYGYDVSYNGTLAFRILSCVPLNEEITDFIRDNITRLG